MIDGPLVVIPVPRSVRSRFITVWVRTEIYPAEIISQLAAPSEWLKRTWVCAVHQAGIGQKQTPQGTQIALCLTVKQLSLYFRTPAKCRV